MAIEVMQSSPVYVPVIRWKGAERDALARLVGTTKNLTQPLIELIPKCFFATDDGDVRKKRNSQTVVIQSATRIAQMWGWTHPHFIDFEPVRNLVSATDVVLFSAHASLQGLKSVLVVHPDYSPEFLMGFNQGSRKLETGLCIRLTSHDFRRAKLTSHLDGVLQQVEVSRDNVDLVIDFQTMEDGSPDFRALLPKIPYLQEWRSITFLGGTFPKDLSNLEKNRQHELPRHEFLAWRDYISSHARAEVRFGDYTIQHPTFEDNEGQGRNFSASIRYAAPEYWVIMRGEGVRYEHGVSFAQWPAQAALLLERSEFRGPDFSWGDNYIRQMSESLIKTGGPKQWLAAGINHHITLTAAQVAEIAAITRARAAH